MRKLASVQTITDLRPIEGADRIEVARVLGWDVVVGKNEFSVGEKVVYVEIDAALPLSDERFAFLAPRGTKTVTREDDTQFDAHVLRTVKLRGQISQGLILPITVLGDDVPSEGTDVAEDLGIIKYEPPIPAQLAGQALGLFDTSLVVKTDAERVQNIHGDDLASWSGFEWVATEKIDGSSVTLHRTDDGVLRVFSRNLELVPNPDLSSLKAAERQGILEALPKGWTIQAEVAGPGIQGNKLKLHDVRLFIFGVFDAPHHGVRREDWPAWATKHAVPVYSDLTFPLTVDHAVAQADKRMSLVNPKVQAEGIVWHRADGVELPGLGRACFKAINNSWLAKAKD